MHATLVLARSRGGRAGRCEARNLRVGTSYV